MKTILPVFILSLCGLGISFAGQATGTTQVSLPTPTAYTSTPQDGNSCIWQRTVYTLNSAGAVVPENHSYIQLEAGMNHLVNGQWVPSKEEIDLQPDGWAAATNGEYQAWFPGDIYQSAATIVGPKGQILQCRPEILCYVDGTNYAVIATAQDSDGVLVNSNTVVYPGAFTNINASIRYVYHPSGFEQDIILHQQPPDPQSLGLNPQTTLIEVFTECFDPPNPTSDGIFTDPASGLQDTSLDFDGMHLTMGKAFSTADTNQAVVEGAPVYKSWLTTSEGRTFLIEKVPYHNLAQPLSQLPLQSSIDKSNNSLSKPANHPLYAASQMLPPARPLKKNAGSIRLARQTADSASGLVLDYVLLPVSLVNQTFQADTTYLMGPYYFELDGTVTFEGGTVIKFQSSTAQFKLNNFNLICLSGPYRPIILTAQDDNTVGETISGSTGIPSGYYGGGIQMFNNTNLTVFHDVRMSYLSQGFITWVPTEFDNIQAINCSTPITHAGYDVAVNNGLFYNIAGTAVSSAGFNCAVRGTHLTVDICNAFADSTTTILGLTNCLFTSTTNLLPGTGTLTTNDVAVLASNSGIYQIVGAGSHYLASGSPYRGIGNTNISATILASLAMKTTYPPLIYSNLTFSASSNLQWQAQRDTNASPSYGYHYDPLDYITDNLTITNSTLTLTNGVAIACYNEPGIVLRDGSAIVSTGTPLYPNWFVRYNNVQEQAEFLDGTNANGGQNVEAAPFGSSAPGGTFKFTHFGALANGGFVFNHNGTNSFGALIVQHSEIWGGTNILSGGTNTTTASLFNNLFFRSGITASNTSTSASLEMTNNLIYAAAISLVGPSGWGFFNNDLDTCPVDPNTTITNGYNAFINCSTNLSGITNFTSTNAIGYQTGPLGYFYQPTNSLLINEGNVPANQLNLTYFTTLTNQVIETNTVVDIGYHYVALGTNGLPLTNSAGIPYYLVGTSSNQAPTITVQPSNLTAIQGSNATFSVTATGTAPLKYQWRFNATNVLAGATNTSLTLTSVQTTNAGNYTVVVTNNYGSVTSSVATLTVLVRVTITVQPTNYTAIQGSNATFGVTATGTSPLSYQWWFNASNLVTGGTNGTLVLSNVQPSNAGNYSVVVTNLANSVTSAVVTLTVLTSPTITVQPGNLVVIQGSNATFSVTATGTAPLKYQWRFNATNVLAGATNTSLTLSSVQTTNAGNYTVVVTNNYGSVTSSVATLTVLVPVTITVQPTNYTAVQGSNATFGVTATGTTPLAYQWWFNATNVVSGGTNATLVVSNVQPANAGNYSVVITNLANSVTSSVVTLTVLVPPTVSITNPLNNAVFQAGTNITIAASAADSDGTITQVQFFQGSTSLGIDTTSPYSLTWSNVAAGSYVLSAIATDNYGLATTSSNINITVNSSSTNVIAGMLDWWKGDGNALDSVGTNNGTIAGGMAYTNGEVNQAFSLNGVDSTFSATVSALTNGNTPHSVEGWFYVNALWGNRQWIILMGVAGTGAEHWLLNADGTSALGEWNGVQAHPTLPIGAWIHLALTFDGTTLCCYTNGQLQSSQAASFSFTSSPPITFGQAQGGDQVFNGLIDEVSVYNRALSSNEVAAIYNAGTNGKASLLSVPPSITTQPTNYTSIQGSNATFNVTASGTAPLAYQWYFNATNLLAGATNTTVTLTSVQTTNAGNYSVLITNNYGAVTSSVATLTVVMPATITAQPTNYTAIQGSNATFSVTATGTAPLSYQWCFNATNVLAGATNTSLTLTSVQTTNAGNYTVVVTNNYGVVTSSVATLTVVASNSSSVTITNPLNNTVFVVSPTNITLQATATSSNSTIVKVQFLQSGTVIGVVSNSPYSLVWSNVTTGNYGLTAIATANNGVSSTSAVVSVTVSSLFASNTAQLWLRADSLTGLTNNAPIAAWYDSSGNSNNAVEGTSTNQPFWEAGVLNGEPVVQFSGSNYLYLPDFLSSATQAEAFVVLNVPTNATNAQSLWVMSDSTSPEQYGIGGIYESFGSTTYYNLGLPAQPLNQYHVFEVSAQTNSWAAWVNGALQAQSTNNTVEFCPGNHYTLLGAYSSYGQYYNPVDFFNGNVAEVLVFNRPLSSSERVTVNTYLNGKYGLVPAVPATPSNLVATAISPSQIGLTWNATLTGGTTQISVERSISSNGTFAVVAQVVDGLSYIDTNLSAGTTYYYQVQAQNLTQLSPPSNLAQATTITNGANFPLSNMMLWLKADCGLTQVGSNTPVSYWVDQSGNGNNASQVTGTNRPIWVTGALNGEPVLQFGGTNYLSLPNFLSTATQAEAYVVVEAASAAPTNNQSLWQIGAPFVDNGNQYPAADGTIHDDFGCNTIHYEGAQSQTLTQYHIYNVVSQPNYWASWINGLPQYQNTANTVGFTTAPHLGYYYFFTPDLGLYDGYFSGNIAEIIIFNRGLSSSERVTVNNYLNGKYGLVPAVPATPSNLVATAISPSQIGLTWNATLNGGATRINVERSTASNGVFAVVGQVTDGLSYIDTNLAAGTTYYYQVQAQNLVQLSPPSNLAQATTTTNGANFPLSSLGLWLKADSGMAQIGTNTPVSYWIDQSGNSNNAVQATGTNRPIWMAGALNGMPVVEFGGSNYLSLPNFLSAATQAEAFVVLNVSSNAVGSQALWAFSDYASFENSEQYGIGGIRDNFGSVSYNNLGLPAQPLNQYHLFQVSAQTNTWSAWINGTLQCQTSSTVQFCSGSDATYLGAFTYFPGYYAVDFFNGNVAELLVFNRTLTADEKMSVGTYLISKYNLSQYAVSTSAPTAPTNLLATGLAPSELNISWAYTSTNRIGCVVERKLGSGSFQKIGSSVGTNFIDTTAIPTNQYFYCVSAENYFGSSPYSSQISPPVVNLTNYPTVAFEMETNLIMASSSDALGTVTNVSFYAEPPTFYQRIGSAATTPFSTTWTPTMPGPFALAALASDSLGNSQFSSTAPVTSYLDVNGDRIPDIWEVQSGNNPLNPWIAPSVNTNDDTNPVITLLVPTNAVIVH